MTITQARLREVVHYDLDTGVFTWLKPTGHRAKVGARVGSRTITGYLDTSLFGRRFLLHRLAWLYVHGEFPRGNIDHINGIKHDNRIANLRVVNQSQNGHNRNFLNKNNRSGFVGVGWHKAAGKYMARVTVNRKGHYVGLFDTAEEAHAAYLVAKAKITAEAA